MQLLESVYLRLLNEIKLNDVLGSMNMNSKKFKRKVYALIKTYDNWDDRDIPDEKLDGYIDILRGIVEEAVNSADIDDDNKGLAANWMKNYILNTNLGTDPAKRFNEVGHFIAPRIIEKFFMVQNFIEPRELRDLNRIQTVEQIKGAVDEAMPRYEEYLKKKAEGDHGDAQKGTELVDSIGGWDIYIPHNRAASCRLGSPSWCTAARGSKHDYYKEYHKDNDPLIIFINKKNPERKYQFHFGTDQYMDKNDHDITEEPIFFYLLDVLSRTNIRSRLYFDEETTHKWELLKQRSSVEKENGLIKLIIPSSPNTAPYSDSPTTIYFNEDIEPHRDDGPAYENIDVAKWYQNGKQQSINDMPAVVGMWNGKVSRYAWYENDKIHRPGNDLPAVLRIDNNNRLFVELWKNGHRNEIHSYAYDKRSYKEEILDDPGVQKLPEKYRNVELPGDKG